MTMTARESMQVYVILAFVAAGFAFHFAFNDGLQTESSSPAAAAAPAITKKLQRARELQQAAFKLNQQRFESLKERKAQRVRVAAARAKAAKAFAAAGVPSSRATTRSTTRASTPAPQPARSAPRKTTPAPKPAATGGGGSKGGSFDDSG
jgi:hypothetical protein